MYRIQFPRDFTIPVQDLLHSDIQIAQLLEYKKQRELNHI